MRWLAAVAAEGVVEHRPLAPLGRPGRWLPGPGLGAGGQRQPHGRGLFQVGHREGGAFGPVEGGGDLGRRGDVAGGGVERPVEQRLPQHPRLGAPGSLLVSAIVTVTRASATDRRETEATFGHLASV